MKAKKIRNIIMSAYMQAQNDLGYESDYDNASDYADKIMPELCKHPYKHVITSNENDDMDYCKKCDSRIYKKQNK